MENHSEKKEPENYRGIALLSTVLKVFAKILAQRVELKVGIYVRSNKTFVEIDAQ